MAVTYGFYDSLNGDRRYNATMMSQIFDGIINDGVFMSVGEALIVKATDSMTVNVGIGRAWFNGTWTYNDSILPLILEPSELILNRIDAVILEVNSTDPIRANTIKIKKGIPATNPVAPLMTRTDDVNQYALCHIYVGKGVSSITQANITNKVGTGDTPFVTGILETMDIDALVSQWGDDFYTWFDDLVNVLDENTAGNLLNLINTNYDEYTQIRDDYLDYKTQTNAFKTTTNAALSTKSSEKTYSATIGTAWTGTSAPYQINVTVTGITATDNPIIDVVMSGTFLTDEGRQKAWAEIYRAVTAVNRITFYAMEKPTVSVPIQIKVVK